MENMSDPRRDRIFKLIFLNHPDTLIHLLNSFLPLESPIVGIEYMPSELFGHSQSARMGIVDVRCRDQGGRHFIVEMQIRKTATMLQRLVWNAARILSMQLEKGGLFLGIQPVYTLCLLDEPMMPGKDRWIHHFSMRSDKDARLVMTGMHFTIVEIGKWREKGSFVKDDMRDAWMLFFTKPEAMREMYTPEDWARYREMFQAVKAWDISRYTEEQLWRMNYEIDVMITNNTLVHETYNEGLEKGMEKGFSLLLTVLERLRMEPDLSDDVLKTAYGLSDPDVQRVRSLLSSSGPA